MSDTKTEEPSIEETIEILQGIKGPYQDHHNVEITDEAIDEARIGTDYEDTVPQR